MVACLAMALAGFLTFGSATKGNVLNNFPTDNILVNIARLCFGLNMLTTLPLECFVCREVMNNYWFPEEPYQPNRHLIFSSALVVAAMAISLITCDLGAVFELIGATSACALAYILPPLCYLKLASRSWRTIPAILCICFGCGVMAVSLVMAVGKMIKSEFPSALRSIGQGLAMRLMTDIIVTLRRRGESASMLRQGRSNSSCNLRSNIHS
jgi:solute carrier family 38 (sodium-coupled neutral amino acid transporter), member 11